MKLRILFIPLISSALLFSLTAPASEAILNPVLRQNGGKATECLEKAMRTRFTPGESIVEWQGPGVRADASGTTDPSTALFVFRMQPTGRWFGLAFYSTDDEGWRMFTYTTDDNRLQIGYRAKNMEPVGYLFSVKPHNTIQASSDDGDYQEVDLSACREVLGD